MKQLNFQLSKLYFTKYENLSSHVLLQYIIYDGDRVQNIVQHGLSIDRVEEVNVGGDDWDDEIFMPERNYVYFVILYFILFFGYCNYL